MTEARGNLDARAGADAAVDSAAAASRRGHRRRHWQVDRPIPSTFVGLDGDLHGMAEVTEQIAATLN